MWEAVWAGSEGRVLDFTTVKERNEQRFLESSSSSLHLWISISVIPFYGESAGWSCTRRKLFQSSTPPAPTHTISPSSLACRTCSGACNRNTMSNAGEHSQAKLSVSSPASGCEILDVTSSPFMKGHGGTGRGVGCMRHDKMGGEAARNAVSVEAITSNSPGRHLKL